jgi:predicted O-methyltransferase YrrM
MFSDIAKRVLSRISRLFYGRSSPGSDPFSPVPIEIIAYDNIEGFLSPREASALFHFASRVKDDGVIVEVGSWKGKSTYCLARGLNSGRIFAIDPFDASGEIGSAEIYEKERGENELLAQFTKKMTDLQVLDKIEILHGYSIDFKDRFKEIDLLFIDGDHSIPGCKADFDYFASAITPGGYLLFHDYYPDRKELGPTWVIENLINRNTEFETVALADSLWVGRRR